MTYSAETVRDSDGCVVVTRADSTIWISDELLCQADEHGEPTPTGELWHRSPLIGFGTPDRGLGALTYVLTGEIVPVGPGIMYVASQVDGGL